MKNQTHPSIKAYALALSFVAFLTSCSNEDETLLTEELSVEKTSITTSAKTASSMVGEVPSPTINTLDVTTCTDGLGGTISGQGEPGNFYVLYDLDGNVVEPNRIIGYDPQTSISSDGSFEFREIDNGDYVVVAFDDLFDAYLFVNSGVDAPQSEPVAVTLECPEDFNNSPVTQSYNLGSLPLGETVVIPVVADSFDPDGDELTVTLNQWPAQGTYELTEAGEVIVTRTGLGQGGVSFIVSDGRGGEDYGTITFRNIATNPY